MNDELYVVSGRLEHELAKPTASELDLQGDNVLHVHRMHALLLLLLVRLLLWRSIFILNTNE